MTNNPKPRGVRQAPRPGAAVVVNTDGGADEAEGDLCSCCTPRNPLVMRPDLGLLADGSPEYALCVLHEPDPMVYRNRGDGVYVQLPDFSLSATGEILDDQGTIVAQVAGDGFQRLTTVDDEDEPSGGGPGSGGSDPGPQGGRASQPTTVHVDLSQDDFYSPPRPT